MGLRVDQLFSLLVSLMALEHLLRQLLLGRLYMAGFAESHLKGAHVKTQQTLGLQIAQFNFMLEILNNLGNFLLISWFPIGTKNSLLLILSRASNSLLDLQLASLQKEHFSAKNKNNKNPMKSPSEH